ncbi:MAG TPA: peptidoglycan DD-metalloendopeptidase family protein [Pyrinomonadaceae bacterium]|nr:peptidoglycan DD-metalloendopeptidase family protein [Pyrinomonadaceae bacterium]
MPISPRARVLLIAVLLFACLAALVWYLSAEYGTRPVTPIALPSPGASSEGVTPPPPTPLTTETPAASPTPEATSTPAASPSPFNEPTPPPAQSMRGGDSTKPTDLPATGLLIPVAGVRPEQLQDTFNDARSEGRRHDAIDIIAPRGTPVVAAADGRLLRLFSSDKGGLTIYQLGTDERTVYYYAHLDRYADGLAEGRILRRGETVAYVGDTGNATPGNYHLHFQIYRISDPKKFWTGDNLNPYELLRGGQ